MRIAACRCGSLRVECAGEPLRVSVCHCRECQRRTGSVFSAQARFPADSVHISGEFSIFVRRADSGNSLTYQFCPSCGSTVAYSIDAWPDAIAVPLGAFADGVFPAPACSIYERTKRRWVTLTSDAVEHHD